MSNSRYSGPLATDRAIAAAVTGTQNHISGPTYICKIYKCGMLSVPTTCYCEGHTSPLRTGLDLFMPGSAPVKKLHPWRQHRPKYR
jgi:hypothetical protein